MRSYQATLLLLASCVAAAQAGCEDLTKETDCMTSSEDGENCAWCTSGAVGASCAQESLAKTLPTSVFMCEYQTALTAASTEHPTFEAWMKKHQKMWKAGSAEFNERKALFLENLKTIIAHNANPKKSYTMGVNAYTASTKSELANLRGAIPEMLGNHIPKKVRSSKASGINMKPVSELPSAMDWREKNVVSPVKDQGHCGSCWAFSATETLESHVALSTGILFSLSPQQIASCTDNVGGCGGVGGCSGGMPQVAFDSIANAQGGVTQEFMYPYNSYYGQDLECQTLTISPETPTPVAEIEGYVQVAPNNYTELMNTIAQVGPVSIVVDASKWSSYAGGVYDGCDYDNIELDHAVQLVGYGENEEEGKYWIVRNSWSPAWGEKGFIRVKRTDSDDDVCDSTMNAGRCKGDPLKTQACGTCGIMYSPSYPTGAKLWDGEKPTPHP